jgi:hypothetical protein
MRRHMIATDAQHLGSQLLQPAVVLPKRGSLGGSAGSEIEHMEGEYDVFLAPELGQTDGLIIRRGKSKVGSNLSDFSRHGLSFLAVPSGHEKLSTGSGLRHTSATLPSWRRGTAPDTRRILAMLSLTYPAMVYKGKIAARLSPAEAIRISFDPAPWVWSNAAQDAMGECEPLVLQGVR